MVSKPFLLFYPQNKTKQKQKVVLKFHICEDLTFSSGQFLPNLKFKCRFVSKYEEKHVINNV